jgi:hypothetical protein
MIKGPCTRSHVLDDVVIKVVNKPNPKSESHANEWREALAFFDL